MTVLLGGACDPMLWPMHVFQVLAEYDPGFKSVGLDEVCTVNSG